MAKHVVGKIRPAPVGDEEVETIDDGLIGSIQPETEFVAAVSYVQSG
jgi:hypothetical protein